MVSKMELIHEELQVTKFPPFKKQWWHIKSVIKNNISLKCSSFWCLEAKHLFSQSFRWWMKIINKTAISHLHHWGGGAVPLRLQNCSNTLNVTSITFKLRIYAGLKFMKYFSMKESFFPSGKLNNKSPSFRFTALRLARDRISPPFILKKKM